MKSALPTPDTQAGQSVDAALFTAPGIEQRRVRALWLIRLRWVAILGQLAVLVPALRTGWLEQEHVTHYLVVVGALGLFNASLHLFRDSVVDTSLESLVVQVTIDLFALGSLLLLTGGVHNPMAPIILVHASLCPLIFSGLWSYFIGTLLLGLIALISLFANHPPALVPPFTEPAIQGIAHIIVSVVIWSLTSWLASALRGRQVMIESLRLVQVRQDRLRATGLLAAGFCHELATPLNTIGLRLARVGKKLEMGDPDVAAIQESLAACERALESMIDQRLDSKNLRFETVAPMAFMGELAEQWSKSNRPVEIVSDGALGVWELPRLLLAQTLADLLDNAHQAMEAVGATEPVRVLLGLDGENLTITVTDSGPGIPASLKQHLGQPFVTTKPGGSGLGLYNATNLCVALGGRLEVGDGPTGGAVVTLVLRSGEFEGGGER